MTGYNVAGRQFRTQADYNAALRDKAQIDEIKAKVNIDNPGAVIRLSEELQAGTYHFTTMVGNDFDDEIYELAEKYKEQGYTRDSMIDVSKKKRKQKNKARKMQKTQSMQNTQQAQKTKSVQNTQKVQKAQKAQEQKNTAQTSKLSLEDYDEQMQQEIKNVLQQKEKRRKLMVILCTITALACFGYFGVYYFFAERTEMDYEQLADLKGNMAMGKPQSVTIHYTDEEEIELKVLKEYETLYSKNRSLIGWLKIADTYIDYPVMQTANNEYYLDHNFNQEYDKNGSLFLDKDCDVVHRNTNLIIYGHHMKSGKMFGNLNKYSSESYAKEHSIIQFDTIYEKGTYQVMYVFRSRIYNEDEIVFKYYQFLDAASEQEFNSNMQEMKAISLYDTGVTASYGDELLTLSTCDNSEEDGRFVVVAKRIQ